MPARPSFKELHLAEFLHVDDRPTIVFDLSKDSLSPAYANPAFNTLEDLSDDAFQAFTTWARSKSSESSYQLAGRVWKSHIVQEQWHIVICQKETRFGDSEQVNGSLPSRERHNNKNSVTFTRSDSDASSQSSIFSNPTLTPTSSSSCLPKPTIIDWTVNELPGLSTFVQQFRAFDWKSTALGPLHEWPPVLRQCAIHIMSSYDPRLILWGPDKTIIYNEACMPIIGRRHPQALGSSPAQVFPEFWSMLEPLVADAYGGSAVKVKNLQIPMFRNGFEEECWFTFTLQPICGPDGEAAGVLDSFTECTSFIVTDRRLSMVTEIGAITAGPSSVATLEKLWPPLTSILESRADDIPFALVYSIKTQDDSDKSSSSVAGSHHSNDKLDSSVCVLEGAVGIQPDVQPRLASFSPFNEDGEDHVLSAAFRQAWNIRDAVLITELPSYLKIGLLGRAGGIPTSKAVVIPLPSLSGATLVGVIVLGLSARRPYDEDYKLFIRLFHDRLSHSVAVISLPAEQRMAQAAAEEAALRHSTLSRQLLLRTQEAERSESKFARMYERAPVGMYLLRPDGTPIYVNQAYRDLTGVNAPESCPFEEDDAIWRNQVLDEDLHIIEGFWMQLGIEKRPAVVEYRLKRPWSAKDELGVERTGTTWLLASAIPDVDDAGKVTSILGWLSDISLQKWSEQLQLKRLEEALEAKYQSERFIDCVSHEIRNPLSAILQSADGVLTILENKAAEHRTVMVSEAEVNSIIDSAKTIVFCTQHQKRIVDDILTFSKLDSNLIALCPEIITPSALLDRAVSMFQSELKAESITAMRGPCEQPQSINENVVCDASRVLQVIINLLTNAIKFTRGRDKRTITLTACISNVPPETSQDGVIYAPQRPGRPRVNFGEDWGTGSEKYVQFAVTDTGRGLAKDEMELLFQRFHQANAKTYSQYGGSGLGLFICKHFCELHGGQIGVSSSLDRGSTFAFYIRALEHVPDPFSISPIRRSSLANISKSHRISDSTQNSLPPFFDTIATLSPVLSPPMTDRQAFIDRAVLTVNDLSILIVEDNLLNAKVMANQLRIAGCKVDVANHGGEALEFIRLSEFASDNSNQHASTVGDQRKPLSIVLMDLEMPIMDGLTCVKRIREMERKGELHGRIPVAAVTANARAEQLKEALDAGMDTIITKPFRIGDLIPRILALANGISADDIDAFGLSVG